MFSPKLHSPSPQIHPKYFTSHTTGSESRLKNNLCVHHVRSPTKEKFFFFGKPTNRSSVFCMRFQQHFPGQRFGFRPQTKQQLVGNIRKVHFSDSVPGRWSESHQPSPQLSSHQPGLVAYKSCCSAALPPRNPDQPIRMEERSMAQNEEFGASWVTELKDG